MQLCDFIDRIVELNIYLDPKWEMELFHFGRNITVDMLGYPRVHVDGRFISLHRIINNTARGMVTDHINGDPTDCSAWNLRDSTHSQNSFNRKGTKGVYFDKRSATFVAQIFKDGKRYRKKFKNIDDAIAYRKELAMTHFGRYVRKE